jgi:hypothetical protein
MNRLQNFVYSIYTRYEDLNHLISFIIVFFFVQFFVFKKRIKINVIDQHLNKKQNVFDIMSKNLTRLNHDEHFNFFDFIILFCDEHLSKEKRDEMSLIRFFDQLKQDS